MSETARNDRALWLHGPATECAVTPQNFGGGKPWRIVLLGAPGVGKGTQAEMLCARLSACHLSTGDIFRAAKSSGCTPSPAMAGALEYMRRGDLVPDQTVLSIVRERVGCLRCRGGFLLDGFPRTVAQAEALGDLLSAEGLALDAVLDFALPIEQIVARLSGRRTCGKCKAVYHVTGRPPSVENVCDHCGGELVQREDDRAESVRVRMAAYAEQTSPLTAFYAQRGLLKTVAADGSPTDVFARALDSLGVSAN